MSVPLICSRITPHMCIQHGMIHFICIITARRITMQFDLRGTSWEHWLYLQAVLNLKTKSPGKDRHTTPSAYSALTTGVSIYHDASHNSPEKNSRLKFPC